MAQRIANRVKENAPAPLVGDVLLGGAFAGGFIAFSAIPSMANNDTVYYEMGDGTDYEVGLGTYVSSGNKLTRTLVLQSSNLGSKVNFTGPVIIFATVPANMFSLPTQTKLTSGSGTYTVPANCRQIRVRCVGGGGGGGGSGNSGATDGGDGADSVFNSIHAAGGKGGSASGLGGCGTTPGTGTANFRALGQAGTPGSVQFAGTTGVIGPIMGGNSVLGCASTVAPFANSGAGGFGGQGYPDSGELQTGSGGQGGEYFELIINNPAASYPYTIGAGGVAGVAGGVGFPGGAGGVGVILIDEIYGA